VVGLIFASIAGVIGILMLLGGLGLIAAHTWARDSDGYYTSDEERLQTDGYAITTGQIDLGADPADWAPDDLLGTARVRAESTDGRPLFLGIARDIDVDTYLRGAAYAELTDFIDGEPRYDEHPGRAPRRPPGSEDFWVAESQGPGERQVNWDVESGTWTTVVMNAAGAAGVSVDADAGVKIDWVIWVGVGLALVGMLLTVTAVVLILIISRRASRDSAAA
jgi:hypothetical protein